MANTITLTSWTNLQGSTLSAATAVTINVANIVSIQTRATAFQSTGVTNVVYTMWDNNNRTQVTLVATETATALTTATNANATAT